MFVFIPIVLVPVLEVGLELNILLPFPPPYFHPGFFAFCFSLRRLPFVCRSPRVRAEHRADSSTRGSVRTRFVDIMRLPLGLLGEERFKHRLEFLFDAGEARALLSFGEERNQEIGKP